MRMLLIVAAFALAACDSAPTPAAPTPTATTSTQTTVAVQSTASASGMLALLNQQRAAQGRGPVSEDTRLSRAARAHAADMLNNGFFSHTGLNGSRFTERARAAGYTCAAAENIAFGQRSELEVVTEWMNSSGHRRNILLGDATEFGIGRVQNHWVLMMGRGC